MEKAILVKLLLISPNVYIISFGLKISDLLFKKKGGGAKPITVSRWWKSIALIRKTETPSLGLPRSWCFISFISRNLLSFLVFPGKVCWARAPRRVCLRGWEGKVRTQGKLGLGQKFRVRKGFLPPLAWMGVNSRRTWIASEAGRKRSRRQVGGWARGGGQRGGVSCRRGLRLPAGQQAGAQPLVVCAPGVRPAPGKGCRNTAV